MRISKRFVDTIDEDGVYCDDAVTGLRLRVRSGSKSWFLRRQIAGKRKDISLGTAERLLDDVRAEAMNMRRMTPEELAAYLKKRNEPDIEKPKTFADVTKEYHEHCIRCGDFEAGGSYETRSFYVLKKHAIPALGKMPIESITAQDVADLLISIWDRPGAVKLVILHVKNVFKYAKSRHLVTGPNPADTKGDLGFLLPKKKKKSRNHGMLPLDRVADFCAMLFDQDLTSCDLFLFSILTATRSLTARLARWEDIDMDAGLWTIKAEDLKISENGDLTVPLSSYAMRVLKKAGPKRKGLVFLSKKTGTHYSETNFAKLMEQLNDRMPPDERWIDEEQTRKLGTEIVATQHGIARACFATWSECDEIGNDLKYDQRVVHACLHHKLDAKYNGAYNRGNFLLRRREILEDWGKFCFEVIDNKQASVDND